MYETIIKSKSKFLSFTRLRKNQACNASHVWLLRYMLGRYRVYETKGLRFECYEYMEIMISTAISKL